MNSEKREVSMDDELEAAKVAAIARADVLLETAFALETRMIPIGQIFNDLFDAGVEAGMRVRDEKDAEIERLTALFELRTECPCLIADDPCDLRCTCADPSSSHGCHCCAAYGSTEQRVNKATALVHQRSQLVALTAKLEAAGQALQLAKAVLTANTFGSTTCELCKVRAEQSEIALKEIDQPKEKEDA